MNLKIKLSLTFFALMILSCNSNSRDSETSTVEKEEIEEKEKQETEESILEKDNLISQLQGKWKEIDYPFRTVEFENSTVKLIEEGIADDPKFERFELSQKCLYENNNIREINPNDIILTFVESKRCEKLKVSNDTLTLNGFSTNTNIYYYIIFLKLN